MIRFTQILGRVVAVCSVMTVLAACDSVGPSGPSGPGWLHADLVSPNGQEGAAVLELNGGRDLGTVALDGGEVFFEPDGSTTRVVVILDSPGQIRIRIRTEDVAELPAVTVVQVADGQNGLRNSLVGYEVSLTGVPDGSTGGQGGAP